MISSLSLPLIDTFISLLVIIIEFSIVHSAFLEIFQIGRRKRNKFLYESLDKVFNDPNIGNYAERIINHAVVRSSKPNAKHAPAYISNQSFAEAISGVLIEEQTRGHAKFNTSTRQFEIEKDKQENSDGYQLIKNRINELESSDVKSLLLGWSLGSNDLASFKSRASEWFHDYEERVSSQYKRKLMKPAILLGIFLAIIMNANLISLMEHYWNSDIARNKAITRAEILEKTSGIQNQTDSFDYKKEMIRIQNSLEQLDSLDVPIGWKEHSVVSRIKREVKPSSGLFIFNLSFWSILFETLEGRVLMGLTVAFGSDKWFALLGKALELRGVIKLTKKN
jgi:hypothetical protein